MDVNRTKTRATGPFPLGDGNWIMTGKHHIGLPRGFLSAVAFGRDEGISTYLRMTQKASCLNIPTGFDLQEDSAASLSG